MLHVLLIHLGVIDLRLKQGKVVVKRAKVKLAIIKSRGPHVQIVWSAILPCWVLHAWGTLDAWIEHTVK